MTTEEARNTEVKITKTERGRRYGNAHIIYDVNAGLVGVVLEVTPTEEQQAERNREHKERKSERRIRKEKEHDIRGNIDRDQKEAHEFHAHNTPSQRNTARTARANSR
jgi:hypothetical protein